MGDLIPKEIDLEKIKLTPKGIFQLVIAFVVVMGIWELSKWIYGKIKGNAKVSNGMRVV